MHTPFQSQRLHRRRRSRVGQQQGTGAGRILTPTEVEAWLGFKWVPDVELKGKGFAHPHPPVSDSVYVIATVGSCAPRLTTFIFRSHTCIIRTTVGLRGGGPDEGEDRRQPHLPRDALLPQHGVKGAERGARAAASE